MIHCIFDNLEIISAQETGIREDRGLCLSLTHLGAFCLKEAAMKTGTIQEIKIDGKTICVKEWGANGQIVYKDTCLRPTSINVRDEEVDSYAACIIENLRNLEDLLLSSESVNDWGYILRAIRRDIETRLEWLFDVLQETIGPLYGIFEENHMKDYPLIDVVHEKDLPRKQEVEV